MAPNRRSLCLCLLCALTVACGGSSPTSPTSPTSGSYVGTWTGFARLEGCSLGSRFVCATQFLPGPSLTIALGVASGDGLSGTVDADNYRFTVTGRRQADGSLNLQGDGTNIRVSRVTMTSWATQDDAGVMTGQFSFHSEGSQNNDPGTATYALVSVAKSGVSPPPFTGPRLSMELSGTHPVPVSSLTPGLSTYAACAILINDGPASATITSATITLIGGDGREFPTTQVFPAGYRPPVVRSRNAQSGCGLATAQGRDMTNDPGSLYRMRLEYVTDDGASGSVEGVAPATRR